MEELESVPTSWNQKEYFKIKLALEETENCRSMGIPRLKQQQLHHRPPDALFEPRDCSQLVVTNDLHVLKLIMFTFSIILEDSEECFAVKAPV